MRPMGCEPAHAREAMASPQAGVRLHLRGAAPAVALAALAMPLTPTHPFVSLLVCICLYAQVGSLLVCMRLYAVAQSLSAA